MSEPTKQPTPRKLRKAREKGNVPFSQDLASALFLAGGALLFFGFSSLLGERLKDMMCSAFFCIGQEDALQGVAHAFFLLVFPLASLFGGLFLLSFAVHFLQKGWIWTWPQEKARGGEVFKGSLARSVFLCLKIVALGIAGLWVGLKVFFDFTDHFKGVFSFFTQVAFTAIAFLLVGGLADFFYQRWHFYRQNRMTQEELKQEKKDTDGNSQVKHSMRRKK